MCSFHLAGLDLSAQIGYHEPNKSVHVGRVQLPQDCLGTPTVVIVTGLPVQSQP